jgi:hypothetical protein
METAFTGDLYVRLSRVEAAEALSRAGYKISPCTLATLASRGGGPPYAKFGTKPIYTLAELLAWAEGRVSQPCKRSYAEAERECVAA